MLAPRVSEEIRAIVARDDAVPIFQVVRGGGLVWLVGGAWLGVRVAYCRTRVDRYVGG